MARILCNVAGGGKPLKGNAETGDVLAGKTFSNKQSNALTGSMPNNGAWSASTSGSGSVTIPAGYHNGSGTVSGSASYSQGVSDAYNAVKVETFSETQMGGSYDGKSHAISLSKTYTVPGTVIAAGVTRFRVKNGNGTKARNPKMSLSYSESQVSLSASIDSVDYGGISVDGIIVYVNR